jgi:hypothetical protein
MNTIDITDRVLNAREDNRKQEKEVLSNMTLPEWMKTPFDAYFSTEETSPSGKNNVIDMDFSLPALEVPKALAASSINQENAHWYDQGIIAFKDINGSMLSIIFNKNSDTNAIDITVTVSEGESIFLKPYSGLSNLNCSLYDKRTELAQLTAAVNHNGSFMFAEGIVIEDCEPSDCNDFISLRFHH